MSLISAVFTPERFGCARNRQEISMGTGLRVTAAMHLKPGVRHGCAAFGYAAIIFDITAIRVR